MPIKSILCAISGDTARGSGLRHAARLARHHVAHLTGVLQHGLSLVDGRYGAHMPAVLQSAIQEADTAHIGEGRKRFADATADFAKAEFLEIDTILAAAQDDRSCLLVMGAFEQSKFAHNFFGGVTTDVAAQADVPVFMAH